MHAQRAVPLRSSVDSARQESLASALALRPLSACCAQAALSAPPSLAGWAPGRRSPTLPCPERRRPLLLLMCAAGGGLLAEQLAPSWCMDAQDLCPIARRVLGARRLALTEMHALAPTSSGSQARGLAQRPAARGGAIATWHHRAIIHDEQQQCSSSTMSCSFSQWSTAGHHCPAKWGGAGHQRRHVALLRPPRAGAMDVMPTWTLDQIAGLAFGVSSAGPCSQMARQVHIARPLYTGRRRSPSCCRVGLRAGGHARVHLVRAGAGRVGGACAAATAGPVRGVRRPERPSHLHAGQLPRQAAAAEAAVTATACWGSRRTRHRTISCHRTLVRPSPAVASSSHCKRLEHVESTWTQVLCTSAVCSTRSAAKLCSQHARH